MEMSILFNSANLYNSEELRLYLMKFNEIIHQKFYLCKHE